MFGQILVITGVATHPVLSPYLIVWIIAGLTVWLSRRDGLSDLWQACHPWVLLVIAMSGSTKIDELYYHALVSARIVFHEEFLFFGFPGQAAIP